jgi:ABC-type bacteriocin/lantibiotic exporter with double-glycine peptidase domain
MHTNSKITPIKQPEEDACGPIALEITASYFKKNLSFEDIMTLIRYNRDEGMSNQDMINAVNKVGLSAKVISNASWEDLLKDNTVENIIIVSWMLHGYIGHFSVVDNVTDTHVYLNNPETGEIDEMEKIVFMRLWFDYDEHWYPEKSTDIQLRWMLVVSDKE